MGRVGRETKALERLLNEPTTHRQRGVEGDGVSSCFAGRRDRKSGRVGPEASTALGQDDPYRVGTGFITCIGCSLGGLTCAGDSGSGGSGAARRQVADVPAAPTTLTMRPNISVHFKPHAREQDSRRN